MRAFWELGREEHALGESGQLPGERTASVHAEFEVLGGEVLDGPIPPLVSVDRAALEGADEVQGEGEHRGRVREASDVDRGDRGARWGRKEGVFRRGVPIMFGEVGGVVLLEDEEDACLYVVALILVGEMKGGMELLEMALGDACDQAGIE